MSYPFQRLVNDLRTRYPAPPGSATDHPPQGVMDGPHDEAFDRRIEHLPKEVGTLLVAIGVAGLLLPGPVGSPFVIAGRLVLWPDQFGKAEDWIRRRFPEVHRGGMRHVHRSLDDMERRYPGTMR